MLISREIIFAEFQPICDHNTSTLQSDGQTDRENLLIGNTSLCVASRGKNDSFIYTNVHKVTSGLCLSYLGGGPCCSDFLKIGKVLWIDEVIYN